MLRPSGWFTAARVQRLTAALRRIPGQAPGLPLDQAKRAVWEQCGGPFDETSDLLDLLRELSLISEAADAFVRTRVGNRVAKAVGRGDATEFGVLLVRAGFFHDQARALIEQATVHPDGSLTCPVRRFTSAAPQLLGILRMWDTVTGKATVTIPKELVAELDTVWALLPPIPEVPEVLTERKAVGDRAEMYTVQFERSRSVNPARIAWVARDSDLLGWDVEDRNSDPIRCIEVKGRRDGKQSFYISENEWRKVRELGRAYHFHFWGNIDLSRSPALEYAALRASGYPIIIEDFEVLVGRGDWVMTPVRWRAERPRPVDGEPGSSPNPD